MPRILAPMADWVRSKPLLRQWAHSAVRLIPDVPWTINVPELGPVRIRLRRHRWFLWEKFAQSDELTFNIFKRLIRPGDVVYDIGANIGVYSRVMLSWCGAAKVVAFEPMRENFELLQANIALAKSGNRLIPYRIALSDVDGEEDLQIDDMTSGTAVLSSVSGGEASVGRREFGLGPLIERVRVATLDHFIERERLPPPQMMKIDTEGAEAKVLAGAINTLVAHHPRLCIAVHSSQRARETLELLDAAGYFAGGLVHAEEMGVNGAGSSIFTQIHAHDSDRLANNNIVASQDVSEIRAAFIGP